MSIPDGPDAVTPAWLTAALRRAGALDDAAVTACTCEILGVGRGFTGRVARYRLAYDRDAPDAPASVIAKFPTADPRLRAALWDIYEGEVRFYREVAGRAPIATPRCYAAASDPAAGAAILLLEDLAKARVGDNLAGGSLADARLALRTLARFHAHWWGHTRLDGLDWPPRVLSDPDRHLQLFGQTWPLLAGKLGDRLPGPVRELGRRYPAAVERVRARLQAAPPTFAHGDFRLDNLLFGARPGDPPLTVIDWQVPVIGPGVADLAYFAGFCLDPATRRAHEAALLRAYHRALCAHGVRGYGWAECQEDYRWSIFPVFTRVVIAGGLLDTSDARGTALVAALIERCAAMIADHDLEGLLAE
jgi:hypothetical protein